MNPMNSSNNLSNKPSVSKWLVLLGALVGVAGFADASYLTIKHFQGALPNCTVVYGCEQVLTSVYSLFLGIPVALFGAIYYLAITIGFIAYLDSKNTTILKITSLATSLGMLASIYFFHLQLVVIKAWCQYCIVSIITSSLLFVIGMYLWQAVRERSVVEANQ